MSIKMTKAEPKSQFIDLPLTKHLSANILITDYLLRYFTKQKWQAFDTFGPSSVRMCHIVLSEMIENRGFRSFTLLAGQSKNTEYVAWELLF